MACPGRGCPGGEGGACSDGTRDKVAVAHWCVGDGELEDAVEEHASAARSASAKAEEELVEIAL